MEPSSEENVVRGATFQMSDLCGIGEEIFQKMVIHGDNIAMVDAETKEEVSFDNLRRTSATISLFLLSRGVVPTDVITLVEKTSLEAFSVAIGTLFTGASINVLDAGWTASTVLPALIPLLKPKIIFCHVSAEDILVPVIKSNELEDTDVIIYGGESSYGHQTYEELVEEFGQSEDLETYRPTAIEEIHKTTAAISCTSGSTGTPKGVMVPHAALHQLITPLRGADLNGMTVFTNSGMSWGSGLFILISGLIGGARRAYTKEPFNEENLLRIMREYKPGLMLLSSYQLSLMNLYLQDKEELAEPFGDVHLLFAVGSKLSPQQVETMQKHMTNGKLVVSYGLTECMGGTTTITCAEYRPGTVGHVLMNTELKIVDTTTGETLGPNQQGEMYLRGPTMLGYYGRPEATAEVLDPETGWFKTGDIGYYDEEHYVYVTDRIKEIAKYKGIYINPSDIEIVMSRHPAVRSCAVVSVPHDEVCDLMVGFVELLPEYKDNVTAQELEQYTNENVQDYEKLRGGLYILDELPVLTHGKIAKALLKQRAKDMLNEIMSKFNNKLLSRM